MNYLISIIIPAYNAEKTIEDTVNSIINQSDLVEIVVVNDGSIDGTETVCSSLMKNYSNFKYIKTENLGTGHARNCGIKNSSGKWIMFLDADDKYIEGSLSKIVDFLLENKSKTDIFLSPLATSKFDTDEYTVLPLEKEIKNHLPTFPPCTYIIKKQFILDHQIYFYEYKEQDIESSYRYKLFVNKPNYDFYCQPFYIYNENPFSNTHTWKLKVLYRIKFIVYFNLIIDYKCNDDLPYLSNICLYNYHKYKAQVFKKGRESKDKRRLMKTTFKQFKSYVLETNKSLFCFKKRAKMFFVFIKEIFKRK